MLFAAVLITAGVRGVKGKRQRAGRAGRERQRERLQLWKSGELHRLLCLTHKNSGRQAERQRSPPLSLPARARMAGELRGGDT